MNHGTQFRLSAVSASQRRSVLALSPAVTQPTWFSRGGQLIAAASGEVSYGDLSLAPDERRLAVTTTMPGAPPGCGNSIQRRVLLTSLERRSHRANLVADGETIVFAMNFRERSVCSESPLRAA